MKHPGMWDDFLTAGKAGGTDLAIDRASFQAIQRKYFGESPAGEVLHRVLQPVAGVMDMILGTQLGSCGSCAERELKVSEFLDGTMG